MGESMTVAARKVAPKLFQTHLPSKGLVSSGTVITSCSGVIISVKKCEGSWREFFMHISHKSKFLQLLPTKNKLHNPLKTRTQMPH